MASILSREELAWAAGFFDGEGNVSIGRNGSGRQSVLQLRVSNSDKKLIDRFHTAVLGLGNIHGPYNESHLGSKPMWHWVAGKLEHCQAVIAMLDQFWGDSDKESQAIKALGNVWELRRLPRKNAKQDSRI